MTFPDSRTMSEEEYDDLLQGQDWKSLSKRLPGIIETMAHRKCFHTGRGNFVTVEVIREDGVPVNYHVFFTASKSTRKGRINIYIQSAYVPEKRVGTTSKPIRFLVILHNTLNQLPIKS